MKNIYFTVGPTQLYPSAIQHIQHAIKQEIVSLNHRSPSFESIYFDTASQLRKIFKIPKTTQVFFTGSALEGMERTVQNCVTKNSFHLIHGEFSKKFYQFAIDYQKKPKKSEVLPGNGFTIEKVKIPKQTELIALTHNETSTGTVMLNEEIVYLRAIAPKALIAIDMVSSAPGVSLDFENIDIAFFSLQKGFGLPAGMGVLLVNDKAIAKARSVKKDGISIGSYHSFLSMLEKASIGQTPETPNVLAIYLLGKVATDMITYGMKKIERETNEKARVMYDFFDHHAIYKPFVVDRKHRSTTTLVINVMGQSETLRKQLAAKGFIVSGGYGQYKKDHIRIANFPGQTMKDVHSLLAAIQEV